MAEHGKESGSSGMNIKKILTILMLVVDVGVAGGSAYFVYADTLGYEPKVTSNAELSSEIEQLRRTLQSEPVMYSMDTFNTNLEGLPRRFIRLEMSVEMYDQEGFEELVTMGGEARDAIMRIVNSKTLDQVDSVQGKLRLKTEIMAQLNDTMNRGVVKNIYFTKFQVQ